MIKIKRACKPGEFNVNGLAYDLESYNKAIKRFGERIKYGIPVELLSSRTYMSHLKNQSFCFTDPEKCCGKIVDVFDDYIVIDPNSEPLSQFLIDLINDGVKLNAFMRYTADRDCTPVKILNIVTFDIMEEISRE